MRLSRLLLIMPLPSLRMVSTEPVMRCVNKVFLSQKAAFFQSGCDTTTRVTPKNTRKHWKKKWLVKVSNSLRPRAFRILCHVKNSTVSSHYSVALQNKWLTATMSNSSSGWALSISPEHSSVPDKVASTGCFHSGKPLWFWSVS